jgi:2-amino-4-hydroxy-6-hydroxymethyldihydropteridine diphosphokinase
MARCLIGCGSNLGRRREQLDRALELLRFMPGVTLQAVSRYRETRPVGGPAGQGTFLNGACLIETELPPRAVLEMLAAVENTLHRDRLDRWGERTIDLDLLLYDDLVVESRDLTVPHPRMATRRFVLEPAAEIAADLPYPPAACTVRDLLDNIDAMSSQPVVAVVGVPGTGVPIVTAAVADTVMGRAVHAPTPLPFAHGDPRPPLARWRQTLAAWAEPLARSTWHGDAHATIVDYWCEALAVAAVDDLAADDLRAFHADVDAAAFHSVAPNVAILLVADAEVFAERIAFRSRRAHEHSDVFADLAPAAALCDRTNDPAAALVQMQERLSRRLRHPAERGPRAPKAVITIDARDRQRAVAEAIAAVEAML